MYLSPWNTFLFFDSEEGKNEVNQFDLVIHYIKENACYSNSFNYTTKLWKYHWTA